MHTIAQALLMAPVLTGEPGTLLIGYDMTTASGTSVPNIGSLGGNITSPDISSAWIALEKFVVDRMSGATGNDWTYGPGSPGSMVGITETVEFWFTWGGADFGELGQCRFTGASREFKVEVDDSGLMRMMRNSSVVIYTETNYSKFQGIAHHYAASKDSGGNWQFFLDGVAVGSSFTMAGTVGMTANALSIVGTGPALAHAWRMKYRTNFVYTSPFTPTAT